MIDPRPTHLVRPVLTALAVVSLSALGGAFAISPPITFVAADVAERDWFGTALDVDGTMIAVGATGTDVDREDAGAVHLFDVSSDASGGEASAGSVAQVATLVASDGELGDAFGANVAIAEGVVLVGAPGVVLSELNEGSAYLFEHDGDAWTEVAKLRLETVAKNDMFGGAVALGDGVAVVGAAGADAVGEDSGTAVVFMREGGTWQRTATLEPNDAAATQRFGSAVAVDGDRILVGASGDSFVGEDPGAAYLFERASNGWKQVARLTGSSAGGGSAFGESVALSGDLALVGARFAALGGSDRGAAYLFERTDVGWVERVELTAPEPADRDQFGAAVAFAGEVALVGAPRVDDPQRDAGGVWAHVTDESGAIKVNRLSPTSADEYDEFGVVLAADGSIAVVGTPTDVPPGASDDAMTGTATVFLDVR